MPTPVTFDARRVNHPSAKDVSELIALVAAADEGCRTLAARGQAALALAPLVVDVDGQVCTLDGATGRLTVTPGATDRGVVIRISGALLDDLVSERRTMLGLLVAGDVAAGREFDTVASWDEVLRALLRGAPVHEPGTEPFDGHDLGRSFSLADDNAAIAEFLATTGFAHLRAWVPADLMEAVAADIAREVRTASLDDPDRWWAKFGDGRRECVRVQRFLDASPTMSALVAGDVYERVRSLSSDGHALRPDTPAAVEALRKVPGVVEGLADFPWHRDCSLGRHPYACAGIAVGLAVRAANRRAGQLAVMAGSHRLGVPSVRAGRPDVGLPVVLIDTEPGDLTLHLSCTLHRTFPPESGERYVVYTTFSLADTGDRAATDPAYAKAASMGR